MPLSPEAVHVLVHAAGETFLRLAELAERPEVKDLIAGVASYPRRHAVFGTETPGFVADFEAKVLKHGPEVLADVDTLLRTGTVEVTVTLPGYTPPAAPPVPATPDAPLTR